MDNINQEIQRIPSSRNSQHDVSNRSSYEQQMDYDDRNVTDGNVYQDPQYKRFNSQRDELRRNVLTSRQENQNYHRRQNESEVRFETRQENASIRELNVLIDGFKREIDDLQACIRSYRQQAQAATNNVEMEALTAETQKIRQKYERALADLASSEREREQLAARLLNVESELQQISMKTNSAHQADIERLQASLQEAREDITRLRSSLEQAEDKYFRLQDSHSTDINKKDRLLQESEKRYSSIESKLAEINHIEQTCNELRNENARLIRRINENDVSRNQQQLEYERLLSDFNALQTTYTEGKRERQQPHATVQGQQQMIAPTEQTPKEGINQTRKGCRCGADNIAEACHIQLNVRIQCKESECDMKKKKNFVEQHVQPIQTQETKRQVDSTIDERYPTIASLKRQSDGSEQPIVQLSSINIAAKDSEIERLRAEVAELKRNVRTVNYERPSPNANLETELQQKVEEIKSLRNELKMVVQDCHDARNEVARAKQVAVVDKTYESESSPIIQELRSKIASQKEEIASQAKEIQRLTVNYDRVRQESVVQLGEHDRKLEQLRFSERSNEEVLQQDLRQAQAELESFKEKITNYEQVEIQNQRLRTKIEELQSELEAKDTLINRQKAEVSTIRQPESQPKLKKKPCHSRAPQRVICCRPAVCQPKFYVVRASECVCTSECVCASECVCTETMSMNGLCTHKRHSRTLGASSADIHDHYEYELKDGGHMCIIGELEEHNRLRRLIADVTDELKEIESKLQERVNSSTSVHANDQTSDWLKKRLQTLTACLARLEESYKLIGGYRTKYLSVDEC